MRGREVEGKEGWEEEGCGLGYLSLLPPLSLFLPDRES